jgi:capsular polysaccharide biosynthesis protein
MFDVRAGLIGALWRLVRASDYVFGAGIGSVRIFSVKQSSEKLFPREIEFFPTELAVRAPTVPGQSIPDNDYYPAIGYRKVSKALVTSNRRVSAVLTGDSFVLPEAADRGPWNIRVGEPTVGGILRQDDYTVLINVRKSGKTIPQGIFVGSWSPHNWFHWVIDTLPSVYLASLLPEEFNDFPLILPDTGVRTQSWLEPLALVRGNRDIVHISHREYSEVENLIWIDSPSCPGPLALRPSGYPHFRLHGSCLQTYRQHILQQLGLDSPRSAPFRKIFLAREEKGNRPYNQQELLAVAAGFEFEPVFLERLSFKESVEVMLDATHVIGPHGAGWANALFCREGTEGLLWTWPEAKDDNWFTNIASLNFAKFTVSTKTQFRVENNSLYFPPQELKHLLSP